MFDTMQCEASQASSMLSSGTLMLLESLILLPTLLFRLGEAAVLFTLLHCHTGYFI